MAERLLALPTALSGQELAETVQPWRERGERIAFVPTMGALHEGHLSLVQRARELAERVVVSIFVNPTQFAPDEDFESYPRDTQRDAALLAVEGCDLVFLPDRGEIYPQGHATVVEPGGPAEGLEGACRPGHFRGVATVVTALFGLVRPELAVFGEKDAQQLAVVRRLVKDLHLGVEIVGAPVVRESDGLALSSRNLYLDPDERRAATVLFRALAAARERIEAGERSGEAIRSRMHEMLASEPRARVDYAEVVHAASFRPVRQLSGTVVLPLAVHIGSTRLIDNLRLTVEAKARMRRPASD